ncbi:hypothetical protein BJ165DRAFT_928320 [Panaeolus papilionaceus]|nr:hypothetical protein BJ165DRAFT_928320 [Panaeolus papilionaceus]
MYIPFISSRSSLSKTRSLERRRGAVGVIWKILGGRKFSAGSKLGGIFPPVSVIPAGQPFAGRMQGGAGRAQVFGSRYYGSGYPGVTGPGTAGRGFPFIFWPVVSVVGYGLDLYGLYTSAIGDYGNPTNTDRPGGSLSVATLNSSASSNTTTTFRLVADAFTVFSLLDDILANCSSHNLINDTVLSSVTPYTDSPNCLPRPESTVQYYRGSSISLALEGYNNSAAAFSNTDAVPNAPIKGLSAGDLELMACLNETIGSAAPIFTSAAGRSWRMDASTGGGVLLLPLVVGISIFSSLF